jgi:hypothetical protein
MNVVAALDEASGEEIAHRDESLSGLSADQNLKHG